MVDASRAAFVSQAFRYEIASDPSVKARFKSAREIVIDTNLDAASAAALAAKMLAATKGKAITLTVEIDGEVTLESLKGTVPSYTVESAQYNVLDGRVFKLTEVETDPYTGTSKLTVRG